MHIASLVLRIFPAQRAAAEAALTALPGVECHGMSEDGKLIVTVEETPSSSVSDILIAVHSLSYVQAVTLAYENNPHLSSSPSPNPTDSFCEEVKP